MTRLSAAQALAERFCRPHRVALFGHRGVGKTTLLTMLYRQAVAGRLPELRLAAGDVPTANYLSNKVGQLESGQPVPATLAETDLRFQLYHRQCRIELHLRDYQGEHVELGRNSPIRSFLADCDALWFCLDPAAIPDPADRLRRQQEIESLIEDHLRCADRPRLERPMALVLTKADLLDPVPDDGDSLAWTHFGMSCHALQVHCPLNAVFVVSSLGPLLDESPSRTNGRPEEQQATDSSEPPVSRWDQLLAQPLAWLAGALQALDESRLDRLFSQPGVNLALLDRCVACFARRYPDSPAVARFQKLLRERKRHRRMLQVCAAVAVAICLLAGCAVYDAIGYQRVLASWTRHEDEPARVLASLDQFQAEHPTRHLSMTVTPEQEETWRAELNRRIRDRDRDARLAELRRHAGDPDADPAALWQRFQEFRRAYPEVNVDGDLEQLRAVIKGRRDQQYNEKARRALDDLLRAADRPGNLQELLDQADRYLAEFPAGPFDDEARRCRAAILRRLDELDIQAARDYSARNPLHFQTRREHYLRYLAQHPAGGRFVREAEEALLRIDREWDDYDFRSVADHFRREPANLPGLSAHCRRYLAVHPQGRYRNSALDLLRWSERVAVLSEYRVVLRSGEFGPSFGRWFTRTPRLSIELEVNGIRHGPSTIAAGPTPQWDYEFPRRIRWKLGDPILIRVRDHNWSDRVMVEIALDPNDPLVLRQLSGEVQATDIRLTFDCDFVVPVLPRIE